ncbi:MAG: DnaJ domain-containing protein, partial [Lysobacter sp.]|nr:DnaJ domain-containing protein [Lysobacter sp.]
APDSRLAAIRESYHGLMALIHPDRQADGEERWPAECAQRVNKAWAVLSDDAARHDYDADLAKSGIVPGTFSTAFDKPVPRPPEAAPAPMPAGRTDRPSRIRWRTTVEGAALVVAALFFGATWWAASTPSEYSTLEGATPVQQSLKFMRDTDSGSKLPSFLIVSEAQASSEPRAAAYEAEVNRVPRPAPKESAISEAELDRIARPSKPAPAKEAPRPRTEHRIAAAPMVERAPATGAAPPGWGAPAAPATKAVAGAPAASEIATRLPDLEILITRMVSYYEEGDLERFLGLYYPEDLGVIEAFRVRGDFRDFFDSTRSRRLRVQQVTWAPSETGIRGKGKAFLVAQYQDERGRLERAVDIEIDVLMHGGRPRIARLSLFPHQ